MCFEKVSLFHETIHCFAISRNISFCLFRKKQGCETNETFCETANFFACFAFSRHKNQPFRQKPLFGSVGQPQLLYIFCYHFARFCICRFAKRFVICLREIFSRNGCETSKIFREIAAPFACFAVSRNSNKPFRQKP
jgi:hypothetical protein